MTAEVPSPSLLAKYGTRGPRYTSYPTAPHFRHDVDRAALRQAWRESQADLSLYMHVPFCQVRCSFCGCHVKITSRRERSVDYVDRLLHEMDLAGDLVDLHRPLRQVQFGGGTPNYLLPDAMTRLIRGIRDRFRPAGDAEWGIECDPRVLDAAYVGMLLDLGLNRFSLGVQDLDPDVMAAVNRPQSVLVLEHVVELLRARGDVPLNLDLIYGLPKQTLPSWTQTVATIAGLRPTRLAVFGYAHVPWLKPHQASLEKAGLPDAALRAALAARARETFLEHGYVEIGMDHYALPEDELARALGDGTLHRNFQGYTTRRGLDMVAVGTSAISKVGRSYVQDEKDLAAWERGLAEGRLPWERGLVMTDDDLLRGEIITDLSCNACLDVEALERRTGIRFATHFAREMDALAEMERDGLLELSPSAIRLTPVGRFLSRNACMVFDAWLERDAADSRPRYSSTV